MLSSGICDRKIEMRSDSVGDIGGGELLKSVNEIGKTAL